MAAPAPAPAPAAPALLSDTGDFAWSVYRAQALREAEAFVQEVHQLLQTYPNGDWTYHSAEEDLLLEREYEQIQEDHQDVLIVQAWGYSSQPVADAGLRARQLEIQTRTEKSHEQLLQDGMRRWYWWLSYSRLHASRVDPHSSWHQDNLMEARCDGFILSIQSHTKPSESFFPILPLTHDTRFTYSMIRARQQLMPAGGLVMAETMRQLLQAHPTSNWCTPFRREREKQIWFVQSRLRMRTELAQLRSDELDAVGWSVYTHAMRCMGKGRPNLFHDLLVLLREYMRPLLDMYHAEQANLGRLMERKHKVPRAVILGHILPFLVDESMQPQLRGGPSQPRLVPRLTAQDHAEDQQRLARYQATKRKENHLEEEAPPEKRHKG